MTYITDIFQGRYLDFTRIFSQNTFHWLLSLKLGVCFFPPFEKKPAANIKFALERNDVGLFFDVYFVDNRLSFGCLFVIGIVIYVFFK